jgi:pentatricopeptide repeat-containing protein PET309
MVEPLAYGVLNTVLPRHVALVQSTTSSLRSVLNGTRRPSLAANFFTPTPRSDKGKEKVVDLLSVEDVLGCHPWAAPYSKQEVWDQGVCQPCLMNCAFSNSAARWSNARDVAW